MDLPALAESVSSDVHLPGVVLSRFDLKTVETVVSGPYGLASVFPIASVTKTFTSALVLKQVQEGHLNLDAPLKKTLPDFRLADPVAGEGMTVRDALCHFSGLPPHTWAWVYGDVNRETWMRERLPHLEMSGYWREKHRYSNSLYGVLGLVLEEVSRKPWEELLQDDILDPLGLSGVRNIGEDWFRESETPHRMTEKGPEQIPPFLGKAGHPMAPAGELMACMPDLARWGQHLLCHPPQSEVWTEQNVVTRDRKVKVFGPMGYGLGWRLDSPNGERRVFHTGQCSGFSCLLSLWPENGCGVAAVTPVSGAADVLLGLDMALQTGEMPGGSVIHPSRENPDHGQVVNEGRAGVYRNAGYGELEIRAGVEGLESRFQTSDWSLLHEADSGQTLTLSEYGARFPFRWDGKDAVEVTFEPAVKPIRFEFSSSG